MMLVNGERADDLPVTDRGLQYGDGVFETIAVHQNKLLCWKPHYRRLRQGCETLQIQTPSSESLLEDAGKLPENDKPAVLKIIITRGRGGRGYRPPDPAPNATRILALHDWPEYPLANANEGITVRFCRTRMGRNPALAGIKHLNRLEQVMARSEWRDTGIAEGIMLDTRDNIISGTMSNLFMLAGNKLLTPALDQCGINGIIRQSIMDIANRTSLDCQTATITRDALMTADAIFLTNSLIGVWPVKQLEERAFSDFTIARQLRQTLVDDGVIVP